MAFIQNTITDLDDLLVTIATVQGKNAVAASGAQTITFTDNNTIVVDGADVTSTFAVGDFIQIGNDANLEANRGVSAQITAISFSSPDTTIDVNGTPFTADPTPTSTTLSLVAGAGSDTDAEATFTTNSITQTGTWAAYLDDGDFVTISGAFDPQNNVTAQITSGEGTGTLTFASDPFKDKIESAAVSVTEFTGSSIIGGAAVNFETEGFEVGMKILVSGANNAGNDVAGVITGFADNGGTSNVMQFAASTFPNPEAVAQTPTITQVENITITQANGIEVTCSENHGLEPEKFIRITDGTFTTTTLASAATNLGTQGISVGDTVIINESPDVPENETRELLVTQVSGDGLTLTFDVAGTNLTAGGGGAAAVTVLRRQYVTLTNTTNYNGRYIVKQSATVGGFAGDSSTVFAVAADVSDNSAINSVAAGEAFGDNNKGIYFTPEIEIDARSGVQTFQLRNAGNLATLGSGVQGQALYSLFKERWKEVPGLTRFDFPMLSITNEQFEFINSWIPKDDTTRKMIRTAGWGERSNGVLQREYSGIITLGTLGNEDQPYFVQDAATNAAIFETDFTGPVNEAVLNYLTVTNAAANDIQYQGAGSAVETNTVDFNGDATFTLVDANNITSTLGQFAVDDVIQISGATAGGDDGYYKITNVNDTGAETIYTVVDADGASPTFSANAPDAATVTFTKPAAIVSTLTDLSVFSTGNILTISNADAAFNGTSRVVNTAGFNSSTFLELDPISATWQVANDATSDATVTVNFDQRTNFKIFVRERGKTYSDADLADIGVTTMTYIVYRFPVSNATDLDINTTNDNAIVGSNINRMQADTASISGFSASGIADDFTIDAAANTITSVGGIYVEGSTVALDTIFSAGHDITLSGYTNGTETAQMLAAGTAPYTEQNASTEMTDNFGKTFTIASVVGNTITVSGNTLSSAEPGAGATQDYTGTIEIFEEHGFYAGAPIQVDGGTVVGPRNYNIGWNVISVPNERVFVITNPNVTNYPDGDVDATTTLNARLQYIGTPSDTYIDLEYFEDTYSGLSILGPWKDATVENSATISIDGAVISDSGNGLGNFIVGAYVVLISTNNPDTINNGSGVFPNNPNGGTVSDPLAYKIVSVTAGSITVDTSIGEYDAVALGNTSLYQYFAENSVLQDDVNNKDSKWYRVSVAGVSTVKPTEDDSQGGLTVNDDPTWRGYYGTSDQDPDAGISADELGASFQVEADQKSAYLTVLDTNSDAGSTTTDNPTSEGPTATKEVVYEWAQWALRQTSTIDTNNVRTGKIADSLVNFVGSTLETSQGVFVADIASVDVNNIRFYDYANVPHVFPLEVLVTLNFNNNLDGSNDSAVFYAYYTSLSTGNDFGTNNALQVNRSTPDGALPVGSDVQNVVPVNGIYQFNYAYASDTADANDGKGAGRVGGTDQNITVIAIGLFKGQYVKASGNITEDGATISLVAPLERNYTDVD